MTILKNLFFINILKKCKKTSLSCPLFSTNQTVKRQSKFQHIDCIENKKLKDLLSMKLKLISTLPLFPLVRSFSSFISKKNREPNKKPSKARQGFLASRPQEKSPLKKVIPFRPKSEASTREVDINLYKDSLTLGDKNRMIRQNKYGYRVQVITTRPLSVSNLRKSLLSVLAARLLLSSKIKEDKKELVLRTKKSTQLFITGKKRLVTCKQVLLTGKATYKKYKKKIRRPRRKKPFIKPMATKIGKISIKGSYNNTILTLTDQKGNTKAWVSAGSAGFKNGRKSSSFAAESTADRLVDRCIALGYTFAKVRIKGLGGGRMKAIRRLCKSNLQLLSMRNHLSIPHNGCRRARKPRN